MKFKCRSVRWGRKSPSIRHLNFVIPSAFDFDIRHSSTFCYAIPRGGFSVIEFRCSQCGKLLRTAARQPPTDEQLPRVRGVDSGPLVGRRETPPLEPLGIRLRRGQPLAPLGWAAAGVYSMPPAQRVSGPATALIVTAILCIIFQVLGILGNVILMAVGAGAGAAAQGPDVLPIMIGNGMQVAMGVFGLAMSAFVLIGAMKMKNLENYSFAMASAIIAMIPCISPYLTMLSVGVAVRHLGAGGAGRQLGEGGVPKLRLEHG